MGKSHSLKKGREKALNATISNLYLTSKHPNNPNIQNKRTSLFPRSLSPLAQFLFGCTTCLRNPYTPKQTHLLIAPTVVKHPVYQRVWGLLTSQLTHTKLRSICDSTWPITQAPLTTYYHAFSLLNQSFSCAPFHTGLWVSLCTLLHPQFL